MWFISIAKGSYRYKLFLVDLKRVYRLVRKNKISVPVFKEKRRPSSATEADIEDNPENNK
jgi:hypothetical protein